MENIPFISDFPICTSIQRGSSIAMFDYQRVSQNHTYHPMNIPSYLRSEIRKRVESTACCFTDVYPVIVMSLVQWPLRKLNWRYLPHIHVYIYIYTYLKPTLYKAYVWKHSHKIWACMVQYLHFRILKFPLTLCVLLIQLSKLLVITHVANLSDQSAAPLVICQGLILELAYLIS